MKINHNLFDSKTHQKEMREAAARRLELEAAQRILDTHTNIGEEALGATVKVSPTDTEKPAEKLAA